MVKGVEAGLLVRSIRRDFEFNNKLARQIQDYWADKGYRIKVVVTFNENLNIHEVRSDLVNGLPRGCLTEQARSKLII